MLDPIDKFCIDWLNDKTRSELSKLDMTIGWCRIYILNALQYEDELVDYMISALEMLEGIRPAVYMEELEESLSEGKDEKSGRNAILRTERKLDELEKEEVEA